MGKTEMLFNYLGYRLDDDPVPILFVSPTQKLVESVSNTRVNPMLRSASNLWSKVAKGKAFKVAEKMISGIRLGFAWAGSPTELSSHPAGIVFLDERDRMEDDVGGEGDPVELSEARTSTYPNGKIIVTSTPTIEGASAIWKLYEQGTQSRWSWPCPHCQKFFVPMFSILKWPEKATPTQALKNSWVECPHCQGEVRNEHKEEMNANGKYISDNEEEGGGVASFWVSGLASPWRTFGQRAKAFLDAVRSGEPGKIQAVVNTAFGELWVMSGEAPPWEKVANLRGGYKLGEVPLGVQRLTMGADIHKNRIDWVIRGWGYGSESWLIDYGEIEGLTLYNEPWSELSIILSKEYGGFTISRAFVDSGYKPGTRATPVNMVYAFCRRHPGLAFPTKGHAAQDKPLRSAVVDVSPGGRAVKIGLTLWHVDSDEMKRWVHGKVEWEPGQIGFWHLPEDASNDYCKQIVAEERVTKPSGQVVWVKKGANHLLDCESLAYAAAFSQNFQNLPKFDAPKQETSGWKVLSEGVGR